MENLCKQFLKDDSSFVFENCSQIENNLNKLAKKYKLSIYLNNGKLFKSKAYGKNMFVILKNDLLIAHANPGRLAKLPTGVGKIKGCKYKLSDIISKKTFDECDINTDWDEIEREHDIGINIWRKTVSGLNKCSIENIRRSDRKPAIHLHCDKYFDKVFLIVCDKLYFRGHRK